MFDVFHKKMYIFIYQMTIFAIDRHSDLYIGCAAKYAVWCTDVFRSITVIFIDILLSNEFMITYLISRFHKGIEQIGR